MYQCSDSDSDTLKQCIDVVTVTVTVKQCINVVTVTVTLSSNVVNVVTVTVTVKQCIDVVTATMKQTDVPGTCSKKRVVSQDRRFVLPK